MAVRIKIKRGSAAAIAAITLQEGELAYALDTNKVYVGDGTTAGGNLIAADSIWESDGSSDIMPA